jgi:hypothetical protein
VKITADEPLEFTATPTVGWLSVNPSSGTTPAQLSVSINPAGLPPGSYDGAVMVSAPGSANGGMGIAVRLAIGAQRPVVLGSGVVNGASYLPGPVAPGSVIHIFGSNLSQTTLASSAMPLPFTLGGVTVSVNGFMTPLFSVSPTQIVAQLPYEIDPGTATLVITSGDRTALRQPSR